MFVIAPGSSRTGAVVVEQLRDRGHPVRAIVRDPAKTGPLDAQGVEATVASLDDARALARVLDGATGLFVLLPEDPTVADFHGHRRRIADAIVTAVRQACVPHVVFLSAAAACVPDGNGPAKDLHYAEQALREAAPTVTVLRASYFQDNVLGVAPVAEQQGIYPSFFASADFALPTIATRDIGRAAARLLLDPPASSEIIDLVGPAYSARDIARCLGRALGKQVRVVDVPAAAHVEALTGSGLPEPFARALAEMFACFAAGRVSPRGDRLERCTTTLDDVLGDAMAT